MNRVFSFGCAIPTPRIFWFAALALTSACGSSNEAMPDDTSSGDESATGDGDDADETGDEGNSEEPGNDAGELGEDGQRDAGSADVDGGSEEGGTSDCTLPPGLPLTDAPTRMAPGSEDFTFDREGNLVTIGLAGGLAHTTYDGETQVIVPNPIEGLVRGLRYLLDGDLLVVDGGAGALVRITPEGGVSTVASGLDQPNGIVIGANGHAYVSVHDGVFEYDPEGDSDYAVKGGGGYYDGVTLSLDEDTVYVSDPLTAKILSADLTVPAASRTWSDVVNLHDFDDAQALILDGMTLDECGNAYVVQMSGTVWRVSPDGTASKILALPAGIITAVNFGSGVGGWKEDALYVGGLSAVGVYEIELGFKGKKAAHLE